MKNRFFCILAFSLILTQAMAQTYHSGTIIRDEVWSPGSTHIIDDDLTISGCTVEIENGVTVVQYPGKIVTVTGQGALLKIEDNVDYTFSGLWVQNPLTLVMEWHSGYIEIENNGEIEAGAYNAGGNNTLFRNAGSYGSNGWKGIRIQSDAGDCYFEYCEFSNAVKTKTSSYTINETYAGGALWINNSSSSSTVRVEDCIFTECIASIGGAIAIVNGDDDISINNNSFSNNEAHNGGVIYTYNTTDARISLNKMFENEADNSGGAGYFEVNSDGLEFWNNVLYDNSAVYGGGIYFDNSDVLIYNNTICHNTATSLGSGCYYSSSAPEFVNNILYFNASDQVFPDPQNNQGNYDYNNIENLSTPWSNNISSDPMFVSAGSRDYRTSLINSSPCINNGDDNISSESFDIDGNQRNINSSIDIGAYEYEYPTPPRKLCGVFEDETSVLIYFYPNPVTNLINLRVLTKDDQQIFISIINMEGKTLLGETKIASEGLNYFFLDVKGLLPGNYLFMLEFEKEKTIAQLITIY